MVTLVDVGVSPVLRVAQFIDARGVPNLFAFRDAFEGWFGIPLNVTEGARSRARQDLLWANWRRYVTKGGAWEPKAAIPYTSIHDEVTRALAVDFGSGLAVASTPQAKWARANGPKYGVHPTGYSFGEPWHYEIRPGTQTITLAGNTGTQIEENDMADITREQMQQIAIVLLDTNIATAVGTKSVKQALSDSLLFGKATADGIRQIPISVWGHGLTRPDATNEDGTPKTTSAGDLLRYEPAEHQNTRKTLAGVDGGTVDVTAILDAIAALTAAVDQIPTGFKLIADNGS